MEYAFHVYNKLSIDGLSTAVDHLLRADLEKKLTPRALLEDKSSYTPNRAFLKKFDGNLHKPPVVVCIGSDLAIGDSLGPIVGSLLQQKTRSLPVFIYGTLATPVTAKEIKYLRTFLKETHAGSQIIAIDAAVGDEGDIGLIKLTNSPLFPGAGANKKLGKIGDISVMGIVSERSPLNYALLNTTRLNLVYTMAETISSAIADLLYNRLDLSENFLKNG
jgi:putative sporulation protein YyaC